MRRVLGTAAVGLLVGGLASKQNGGWFTVPPAQGAVPFEPGTQLPFEPAS